MAAPKRKTTTKSETVKEQTPIDYSEKGTVKYRCDFKSWEEYNKYKGNKK